MAFHKQPRIAAWYIPAKDASSKKVAVVGHQSWAQANKSGCIWHARHGCVVVQAIDYVTVVSLGILFCFLQYIHEELSNTIFCL